MTSKHPYSYIDDRTINPLLLCSMCNKPFVDPVRNEDNKSGCRECFMEYSSFQSASLRPIEEFIILEMLNSLLVKCVRCGEKNIRRGDLKQHEQKACRRAIVPCKAADIKCPWKGVRELLEEHMEHCVFQPLRPALAEIIMENKQFKEQINQLEILIKKLKEKQPTIN